VTDDDRERVAAALAGGPPPEADAVDDELLDERNFLLRSLTDLEAELAAGDIQDDDYRALVDRYTTRAAAVLREIDEQPIGEQPEPAPRRRRWLAPAVIAVMAGFGIAAGLLLAHNSGTRLPGDNISGSTPTSMPISAAAKLNAQAQQQIQQSDILGAIKTYDAALKLEPDNAEALAYKGWLLRLAGAQAHDNQLIDGGLASIRRAEQVDPAYPDAHFFAGETLLRDKGDPVGAISEFQQFLADNPPQAMVAEVQLEMQSAQKALATSTTTTAPP
jgi:tetratricopeptide (TPR) repeat protein